MSELVQSIDIPKVTIARQQVRTKIEAASVLLQEAAQVVADLELQSYTLRESLSNRYRRRNVDLTSSGVDHVNDVMKDIDTELWRKLMNESGLITFMSAKRRDEWRKQLDDQECPEFTPDIVVTTIAAIHEKRDEMKIEGVVECFKGLSWDYKTNSPKKFGKKIVIEYFAGSRGDYYPNHDRCAKVDDLMRLFHLLEGLPEVDHRQGTWYQAMRGSKTAAKTFENDFISVKMYKKGTAHVTFKRQDLVKQLNLMLAKACPNEIAA